MIKNLLLILFSCMFICSCSGIKKDFDNNNNNNSSQQNNSKEEVQEEPLYTVKVINDSFEKVLIRYQTTEGYSFKFVDSKFDSKFKYKGEIVLQYSFSEFDDSKILRINQHTLIHIKKDDIIIENLPETEILK